MSPRFMLCDQKEHPHTAYFLAHLRTFHPCSHAPHGSRCRMTCLTKTCSSTRHHVSDRSFLYPGHHPPFGRNRRVLNPLCTRRMRSIVRGDTNPLTGYEPNQLDNFDYSETFAAIFQNESGDTDTEPSYSCDAELDDELIGKALCSPPANLRQNCHSHEERLLPAQSFFHTYK